MQTCRVICCADDATEILLPQPQQQQQPVLGLAYSGAVMSTAQRMSVVRETPRHRMSCASRQLLGLGITLIVVGILAFIFNGVAISFADALGPVAHGFWGGTMVSFVAAAYQSYCYRRSHQTHLKP